MKTFEQFIAEFTENEFRKLASILDEAGDKIFNQHYDHASMDIIKKLGISRHRKERASPLWARRVNVRDDDGISEIEGGEYSKKEMKKMLRGGSMASRETAERYPPLDARPASQFMAYLTQVHRMKFHPLGEGGYSMAFIGSNASAGQKRYVLKFTKDQQDWKFIETIMKNKLWEKNSLWPRYYYMRKFDTTFVSVMEEITKTAQDLDDSPELKSLGSDMLIELKYKEPSMTEGECLQTFFAATEKGADAINWLEAHGVTEKQFIEFFLTVRKLGGPQLYWDLHRANWGTRANGQIVFFDPIASPTGSLGGV